MNNVPEIPTEKTGVVLREFTTPRDDIEFFGLIEANREHWADIAHRYLDIEAIEADRLAAKDEHELRLGIRHDASMVGWVSLITYDIGDNYGNWLGVWVDQQNTSRGYGTLAARAAIKYVQDTPDLNKLVTTTTSPDNVASISLLKRLGFHQSPDEEILGYAGELVFKLSVDNLPEQF